MDGAAPPLCFANIGGEIIEGQKGKITRHTHMRGFYWHHSGDMGSVLGTYLVLGPRYSYVIMLGRLPSMDATNRRMMLMT